MKFRLYYAAGMAAALLAAGCGRAGSVSGDAAMVGKDPITMQDYYDYLSRKPSFYTIYQGRQIPVSIPNPGFQAMQDLIEKKIIEQLAKEAGVYPNDQAVKDELTFQQQQQPHLLDQLTNEGFTLDEVRADIRDDLCRFNLMTKGVTVTPAQVDAYIKANPKAFMTPPTVQALMIMVKTPAQKAKVDAQLIGGDSFAVVAQANSLDTNGPSTGYHYPETDESKMAPALRQLFDKTPELKNTDWITLGKDQGFVKFNMEKKAAPKAVEITPYIKERVRRMLMEQAGLKAGNNLDKLVADRIKADKDTIKINIKQNAQAWKDFQQKVTDLLNLNNSNAAGSTPQSPEAPPPGTPDAGQKAPAVK